MGGTHFLQTGYLLLNRNAPFDFIDTVYHLKKEKQAKCNELLVKCNTLSFPILLCRSQNTIHPTSIP